MHVSVANTKESEQYVHMNSIENSNGGEWYCRMKKGCLVFIRIVLFNRVITGPIRKE